MTLVVESISSHPMRERAEGFMKRQEQEYRINLANFLKREAAGEVKAPNGPFTKENGWDVDPEHGIVCWGGGPVT